MQDIIGCLIDLVHLVKVKGHHGGLVWTQPSDSKTLLSTDSSRGAVALTLALFRGGKGRWKVGAP